METVHRVVRATVNLFIDYVRITQNRVWSNVAGNNIDCRKNIAIAQVWRWYIGIRIIAWNTNQSIKERVMIGCSRIFSKPVIKQTH